MEITMNKKCSFFITSGSVRGRVPGFWTMDLSSEWRTPDEQDYADYWVSTNAPERLCITASPRVSLDLVLDSHGKRSVNANLGGEILPDPITELAISNFC